VALLAVLKVNAAYVRSTPASRTSACIHSAGRRVKSVVSLSPSGKSSTSSTFPPDPARHRRARDFAKPKNRLTDAEKAPPVGSARLPHLPPREPPATERRGDRAPEHLQLPSRVGPSSTASSRRPGLPSMTSRSTSRSRAVAADRRRHLGARPARCRLWATDLADFCGSARSTGPCCVPTLLARSRRTCPTCDPAGVGEACPQ